MYFCCLYGNSEDEVIIRCIDRDMAYEQELVALEDYFWHDHVLAKNPPPYTEDGDLILESLRRSLGPSDKDAPPVLITPPQFTRVARYLELQAEKSQLSAEVRKLEAEMQRMKAMIAVDMGKSCKATYEDAGGTYTISLNSSRRPIVSRDQIDRMKVLHPDLYSEYVTFSESRKLVIKKAVAPAA